MNAPNPIFVTGLYGSDPSKGDNLNAAIQKVWHGWGIDLVMSVYDRDLMALIPKTGPLPVFSGHSWGFGAIVKLLNAMYAAGETRDAYAVSIDGVPLIGQPSSPFVLPPIVKGAYSIRRSKRSDGLTPITSYFSQPIADGLNVVNVIYVPKLGPSRDTHGNPIDPQAAEHGEKVWDVATANWVKKFMALSVAPIATPSPAPVPSMPVTLDSLAEVQANHERRIAAMEEKLKQQP